VYEEQNNLFEEFWNFVLIFGFSLSSLGMDAYLYIVMLGIRPSR